MVPTADNASGRTHPDRRSDDPGGAIHQTEWLLLAVLFVAGSLLRCWHPSHMAVEHFDEGVYASNLLFPQSGGYPYRQLYAPPLLPALLEGALILSGGAAGSVMWVNVLAGCLMIPSVWWIGRAWFGPLPALAAALLASFSGVHILYSRAALTDGLLCLWMLWGVYWAWRAIVSGRPAAILLAGLFACLAWWTKYSGWLTLAVSGAGAAAWLVTSARTRAPVVLVRWGVIAALTFVGWLPYLFDLQSEGGYAAVAANHAGYFVGVGNWVAGLLRQWANMRLIEGAIAPLAMIALFGLAVLSRGTLVGSADGLSRKLILALGLGGAVFVLGTGLPFLLLSGLGLRAALRDNSDPSGVARRLAGWMITAWIAGLTLSIPLYTPYPRLTLPWVVATWFGAGLGFEWLVARRAAGKEAETNSLAASPIRAQDWIGIGCLPCALALSLLVVHVAPPWDDRRALQMIGREIHASLPDSGQQIVYVLGQPGLFFHLGMSNPRPRDRVLFPGADLASLSPPDPAIGPVTMYVVFSPHTLARFDDPAAGISWAEATLLPVEEWEYDASRLVLLNEHSVQTIEAGDAETFVIRLGRIGE